MDHLPFPQGTEPPAVPFVGTLYNHPSGAFSRFPLRRGMREDLSACSFVRLPPGEYQAFFQTWLYFGCLSEISNIIDLPIDTACFVQRTSDGGNVVSSASLNTYLDRWRRRRRAHSRSKKTTIEEEMRLEEVLRTVRKMLTGPLQAFRRFLASNHPNSPTTLSWPNIALSIAVLGYTFRQVSNRIYGHPSGPIQRNWGVRWVLQERLQGSNWCRALIAKFLSEQSIDFMLFVSSTPFPHSSESHEQCTDTLCCGKIINTDTYKTSHVMAGCVCSMMEMPSSAAAIVDRGGIPLAIWSNEGGLKVVEYQPNMPYVAISHVWSDGKGNRELNALPECQLKSIQEKVEALYAVPRADPPTTVPLLRPWARHGPRDAHRKPKGFWMDTLCVPVGKSNVHLRRKAIMQMRKIYEEADRVLVLDNQVQQLSVSSPWCDRVVRLIVSNWQSRIWTLQEGVMAQQLFIQFSDGVFALEELQEEEGRRHLITPGVRHSASPEFWHRITTGLSGLLSFDLRFDPEEENADTFAPDALFSTLLFVAKKRRTSWREDETICLSALIRLDTSPLLDVQFKIAWEELRAMPKEQWLAEETRVCEERMERFLCMIGRFDKSIIFSELPRLSRDGFRWAPSSFLGQSGTSSFVDRERFHQVASPFEDRAPILFRNPSSSSQKLRQPDNALGLMVTFPGIMLHTVSRPLIESGTFYVREKRFNRFLYCVTLKKSPSFSESEYAANRYALITLCAPTRDTTSPIPAAFGLFLGMMNKRVRKLQHLVTARVKVIDRRRNLTKEKAASVQTREDELEEGEAWVDEDSDNCESAKSEKSKEDSGELWEDDSEYSSSEHREDLEYAISNGESRGDLENDWESGERCGVDSGSGSDSDSSQEVDNDGDDEEDEEDDRIHAGRRSGYDSSPATIKMSEAQDDSGTSGTEEESDDETSDSEWGNDSEQDDRYALRTPERNDITGTRIIDRDPSPDQIVYGKVLLTDNNKWCIM